MSGEIPAELGNLASLGFLAVAENQLSGCAPASLEDQLVYAEMGGLQFCR